MKDLLTTPYLSFKQRDFKSTNLCEQIASDNIFSREIAQPLFDAGLAIAGIIERVGYDASKELRGRPRHIFMLSLQGVMDIKMNGKRMRLNPGELLCSPVGTILQRSCRSPAWWLYFEFSDVDRWSSLKDHGPYIRRYEYSAHVFLHLRTILNVQNKGPEKSRVIALDSAATLVRLLSSELEFAGSTSPHVHAIEKLMTEIVRQPERNWTVQDMAKQTAMSKSHLSGLFKQQYGLSPIDSVIKQRMHKAIDLLVLEHKTVEDTARIVGYHSICSFSRLFTKHVGMSPRQYRKTCRQHPAEIES